MYIIGLTGNIATGKSTVSRMLAELGAHVIDADTPATRHASLHRHCGRVRPRYSAR
jgi:dephospho-CoA kinase